jgi:L-histidine N-alpha-methyltransferase
MDVRVDALALDVAFAPREELRTEISAKFTPARLEDDLAAAGLRLAEVMTDRDGLFALSLSTPGQ